MEGQCLNIYNIKSNLKISDHLFCKLIKLEDTSGSQERKEK